ncbi:hypothetical protein, partial [Streptomyces indicus]|uniref:hypothetical protein n=1 Tax=Streptomyces indicus TaxID=417292 RepID=UPI001C408F7A
YGGISRLFSASSLMCHPNGMDFSKGTASDRDGRDGVVNLALTFGTLLSSQGTDASFVLTLSGFPPGFPSVFPTLSDSFGPDFLGAFRFPLSRFPSGGVDSIRSFRA